MERNSALFAAWRLAEQEAKLLYAYWASAVARNDVGSASQLAAKLALQRDIAHGAFMEAMEGNARASRACRWTKPSRR